MPHRSWKALRAKVRSTLRYKLLLLVLFPTLLAMPVTLGLTIYWFGEFNRENLRLKVKSDLALAQYGLEQIQQEHISVLQRLADSYSFRLQLTGGDEPALRKEMQALVEQQGFLFAHITDQFGNWLYELPPPDSRRNSKPSPLTDRALRGQPATAVEVFSVDDLRRESAASAERARVALQIEGSSPRAVRTREDRALVLRAVYPVLDASGRVLALLDAGVLVNGNHALMNTLRDRVYGVGTLPAGGVGTVALLLDDVRVGASLPLHDHRPVLGTRVPPEIRDSVLGQGSIWAARDDIGADAYIAAYAPLFDVHGKGVGMLQTGFLLAPFRLAQYRAAALLLLIFLISIAVSTWIVLRGAKSIFKPIEQMTTVVRATQAGREQRIGDVPSQDEIGELARQFDAMLDLLQERSHEIQRAANELERKVEERTRELEQKNTDLERTVKLLQETREKLLMAEKLAALGQMAAGIAHEINNPTAVILGHVDLLVAELGDSAKHVQGDTDMIVEQCERIRHIVDGLLQFARPPASLAEGEIELVDVNRAVLDTLPLVRYALEKVPTTVRTHLATTRRVRIRRYELQEVLINLLLNAARASAPGSLIEVSSGDWDERGVVVSVRDFGVGIAPERISRVFDPFYTTDSSRGTGLGLSVSYGLVQRYSGEITVESERGRGSTFHVWLLEKPVLAAAPAGVPVHSAQG